MYMCNTYVDNTELHLINPNDESHWKPDNEIALNPSVEKNLTKVECIDEKIRFLSDAKKFLVQICNKLQDRCNFDDEMSVHIKCLHPKNALSIEFHNEYVTLTELILELPKLTNFHSSTIKHKINEEWKELLAYNLPDEIINESFPDIFWSKIKKCVREDGQPLFENVSKFALNVLILPNSNAASERVMSSYNMEMNCYRASLKVLTTRAILLSLQYIKDSLGLLFFEPDYDMFLRMIRNLSDKLNHKKEIEDCNSYKGLPITKELIMKCKEEEELNVKIKKKLKSNEPFPNLSEILDDSFSYDMQLTGNQELDEKEKEDVIGYATLENGLLCNSNFISNDKCDMDQYHMQLTGNKELDIGEDVIGYATLENELLCNINFISNDKCDMDQYHMQLTGNEELDIGEDVIGYVTLENGLLDDNNYYFTSLDDKNDDPGEDTEHLCCF